MNDKALLQAKPFMWLMLAILLTSLVHFSRFPLVLSLLIIAAMALKVYLLAKEQLQMPKSILLLLTIVIGAIILLYYGTFAGHEAGSALLVGMLALKLLESTTTRDAIICVFLAYFLAAVNFLFSQDIPTALWMMAQVLLITYCLISISQQELELTPKHNMQTALKLTLSALPIMLILFVLFPRIPGPLWGIPKAEGTSQTGFSDSMTFGKFSELVQSSAVAFRVDFKGHEVQRDSLYWRALTLDYYDGEEWTQGFRSPNTLAAKLPQQPKIDYSITLEPHQKKILFTLDMPLNIDSGATINHLLEASAKDPVNQVSKYSASSALSSKIEQQLKTWQHNLYLQLPAALNPQTIELGKKWQRKLKHEAAIINAALDMFRQQNFHYTLRPLPLGKHKADDFLFVTKKGFCEHYAASFVLLMRAAGIPARVVVGYQGGEVNPLNKILTVRQSDAHAWSEIYSQEHGAWIRIDPTAAVSPLRIEQSLGEVLAPTEPLAFFTRPGNMAKNFLNMLDAIDNGWNQWVLAYGPQLQQSFLENFGLKTITHFVLAMLFLVAIFLSIMLYFMLRGTAIIKPTLEQKIYRRWLKKMQKHGYKYQPHYSATEFATIVAAKLPAEKATLFAIARAYNKLRYSPQYWHKQRPSPAHHKQLAAFKNLCEKFTPTKRRPINNKPPTAL